MNMHQHQFSDSKNSNINSIWGISEWVNHIQEEWLETYTSPHKNGKMISFVWSNDVLEYAFLISNWTINQISRFELWTLKAKWLWKDRNNNFISAILKKTENISQFNKKIDEYISIDNQKINNKNIVKNPTFPDNTYIYKNQYWKEFKVVTMWWKAINITCDNNYITGHQRWAITRAINENRLDKFEEFIPVQSTQLSVVDETNKILTWEYLWKEPNLSNIDNWEYYENIRQKIADSSNLILSAHYIDNIYSQVEDFSISNFPSIKHIEAAENFILIMYKRTWVDTSTISDLLQTCPTIHYMFDKIDESIWNEWYNVTFVQILLQLSEIIKNIFLSMVSEEKRAYH